MHFLHSLESEHNTIFANHIHQPDNATRQKVNGKVNIIYWLIQKKKSNRLFFLFPDPPPAPSALLTFSSRSQNNGQGGNAPSGRSFGGGFS